MKVDYTWDIVWTGQELRGPETSYLQDLFMPGHTRTYMSQKFV